MIGKSIFVTSDGGFVLSGSSNGRDIVVLKVNSKGTVPGCERLQNVQYGSVPRSSFGPLRIGQANPIALNFSLQSFDLGVSVVLDNHAVANLCQPPPIGGPGWIWGFVTDDTWQRCIPDALLEIVDGPGTGRKVVQKEGCTVWDDYGGFKFNHLPLGVTIRLRATKEGYKPKEVETMSVTSGRALNIHLEKQ